MNTLRGELADYLTMRRSLGYSLRRDEKLLGQFLTFLEDREDEAITAEAALTWASLPGGGPAWLSMRMSVVRGFARHMHALDPAHQVPPTRLLPPARHRAVPYLYSDLDVTMLMDATAGLRYPLGAATYRTLIGLLSATGLRIGEALALDDGDLDLDLDTEVLTVHKSKTNRSRIVPLHPSTVAALTEYQRQRHVLAPRPVITTPALFVSTTGTRLAYVNVSVAFVKLVARAGITARCGSCRPRPHDLRHAFAVSTLLDWYADGGDIAARLPLLSTYLGHREPKNTYWYLQASPELLALAAHRLDEHREGRP